MEEFKNIFSRQLFTILFRIKIVISVTDSIFEGKNDAWISQVRPVRRWLNTEITNINRNSQRKFGKSEWVLKFQKWLHTGLDPIFQRTLYTALKWTLSKKVINGFFMQQHRLTSIALKHEKGFYVGRLGKKHRFLLIQATESVCVLEVSW